MPPCAEALNVAESLSVAYITLEKFSGNQEHLNYKCACCGEILSCTVAVSISKPMLCALLQSSITRKD